MRALLVPLLCSVTAFAFGNAAFHLFEPEENGAAASTTRPAEGVATAFSSDRPSAKERTGQVLAICQRPEGMEKDHALFEAIQAMEPADFTNALANLPALGAAMEKMERREDFIEAALERWLDLDEAGALQALLKQASATPLPHRFGIRHVIPHPHITAVLEVLARRTPKWLFEHLFLLNNDWRGYAGEIVLSQSARANPRQARDWLETFRSDEQQWPRALKAYVTGLAAADPGSAIDLALSESKKIEGGPEIKASAFLAAISQRPSLATELLEKLDSSEAASLTWEAIPILAEAGRTDLLTWLQERIAANPKIISSEVGVDRIALQVLLKEDAPATIHWVQTLPLLSTKRSVASLVALWSESNPEAALDWLTAQPVDALPVDLDELGICAISDPARFQKWVDGLPPGERRERAGYAMARHLADCGRIAEARQCFPRDAGSAFVVDAVRNSVSFMAESDPAPTAEWVRQLPSGLLQSRAAAGVVEEWARKAPAEAAQWVQRLPVGAARDSAAGAFATAVVLRDAGSATLWVDQIGDAEVWAKTVQAVFKTWVREEPGRARQWLNGLPRLDGNLKAKLLRRSR